MGGKTVLVSQIVCKRADTWKSLGTTREVVNSCMPLFPPRLCNCHDVTLRGESRTNNLCESWNRLFQSLIGCSHPTISRLIDSLRKDNINVETCLLLDSRGQCPRKRELQSTKNCNRPSSLCAQISAMDEKLSREPVLNCCA